MILILILEVKNTIGNIKPLRIPKINRNDNLNES